MSEMTAEQIIMSIPPHRALTDFEQIAYAHSLVGKPVYNGSMKVIVTEAEFRDDEIHIVARKDDELNELFISTGLTT